MPKRVKTAKQRRAAKKRKQAAAAEGETKAAPVEVEEADTAEQALQVQAYLRTWKHDKAGWKFNKALQTRLLKRYFSEELIPEDLFAVFLEYMESVKGLARDRTLEQAKTFAEEGEEESENEGDEGEETEKPTTVKRKRAQQLLQTLSTTAPPS